MTKIEKITLKSCNGRLELSFVANSDGVKKGANETIDILTDRVKTKRLKRLVTHK